MSAPGRPKRECRSAQREGSPVSAPGRPKRELLPLGGKARSAKGAPTAARPPEGANRAPPGGSAAAQAASVGVHQ